MTQLYVYPMSIEDGKAVCEWKYEAPYDCYNWPSWNVLLRDQREFADEDIRKQQYFTIKDEQQTCIAFFQLFPLLDTIRLGLFVHPSWLNRGIGKQACKLAVRAAKQRFSQPNLDLEVASWNKRAIHVYEQCQFKINDEYILYNRFTKQDELIYNMVYEG